jgi:acetyl esterase
MHSIKHDASVELSGLTMIGRTYLERGEPVIVLARWSGKGPRNVLIRRANGPLAVRPFRGLRKNDHAEH